jgi:endogenous inhibitor of DNA gyrase (YacG/DUF329 family)
MDTQETVDSTRTCAACHKPLPTRSRRTYCSAVCKSAAWKREHQDDTDRQPVLRKKPAPAPAMTLRDCPHCGEPVAIVTLLTTPQVASLDTPCDVR